MDLHTLAKHYFEEPFRSKEIVETIGKKVIAQEVKLFELIEALQENIVSSDVEVRAKVCSFLEEVVYVIPSKLLSPGEVGSLCEFLCAKLKDHYSLHPAVLRGLHKLSLSKNLNDQYVEQIISTLFQEVHVQSCFQSVRSTIYEMLINLFDLHQKVVLKLGKDFVFNLIRSVEGEQEPRNLLLVFQLWHDLITGGIDFKQFNEDVFEVVSCYFPIDFNPPPSGKKAPVTCEDLVGSLRKVLASSGSFASFCIPLMLEKLEGDVQSAKIDAALTLKECLKLYNKKDLRIYIRSIWHTISKEVKNSSSAEFETAGLGLLEQLVRNIAKWPEDHSDPVNITLPGFLQDVIDDCLPSIKQQQTDKQGWMAIQLLLTCVKASASSYQIITKASLPLIIKELTESVNDASEDTTSLPFLVDSVQTLLNILLDLLTSVQSMKYSVEPLEPYKDRLLNLLLSALKSYVSTQAGIVAVACLAACSSAELFTSSDLQLLLSEILHLLDHKDCQGRVRHELLLVNGFIAKEHPSIVDSIILPKLINNIYAAGCDSSKIKPVLNFLSAICTHYDILKKVVVLIVDKTKEFITDKGADSVLCEFLKCLQYITSKSSHSQELSNLCVKPLLKLCIVTTLQQNTIDIYPLKLISSIISNCIRKIEPSEETTIIVDLLLKVYLDGNLTSTLDIAGGSQNKNFLTTYPRLACLLAAAICALKRSIKIDKANLLQDTLLDLYSCTGDQTTYVYCCKAIASLINKGDKEDLISKVEQKLDSLASKIGDGDCNASPSKIHTLTMIIWATKALAMCNHKKTSSFVDRLLSYLPDEQVGLIAAGGFDIIMHDSEDALSTETHAVKKLMYKQRFFLIFMPKIRSFFDSKRKKGDDNEQASTTKANCLSALSNVLVHIPRQVLLQQMTDLIPLLLHSLQSDQVIFLKSVLSTLFALIQDAPDIMQTYIDTLMKNFLRLVQYEQDMDVRIKTLQCIGVSTALPSHVILPLRSQVLKGTEPASDDRKRLVRCEAAKARSEWFLLGST